MAEAKARIAVDGYMLQGVVDDEHRPWVYTVGLVDVAAHPELIIAGVEPETSAYVLNAVVAHVLAGCDFDVGSTALLSGWRIEVGAVHEIQYELDTFASWFQLHAAGAFEGRLEALQLFVDDAPFQPDLSDPSARVGALVNRAARRRRRRRSA
jgi:hypothetical protein